MSFLVVVLAIAVMAVSILLIPFGLPGTWIMILILAIATYLGEVALVTLLVLAAVALVAEVAEFWVVQRANTRYGGSSRAFWGAMIGGFVGIFIGLPIPIVGGLIMGVVGTFVGAGLVAYWETRQLHTAGRVGWGTVVGRAWSAAVKVAAGVAILVVGSAALLW